MSYVQPIPPLRDLPQGRLALRSQHLRAELGRPPERTHRRRKALVLVAAAAVVAATLLATPALGLRDGLAHLFGADRPPPDVIQRYFTNQDPQGVRGLLPAKARLVSALASLGRRADRRGLLHLRDPEGPLGPREAAGRAHGRERRRPCAHPRHELGELLPTRSEGRPCPSGGRTREARASTPATHVLEDVL